MIYLFSDVVFRAGGVETYLHALATHLHEEKIPFRIVVAELEPCPLIDELITKGIEVYRQRRLPGDTWLVRQRFMIEWLGTKLRAGDWVFCVRQPMPQIYLRLVRTVHRRRAKIAVSWMLAPEFIPPTPPHGEKFVRAIEETDAVISVSHCTKHQFADVYGYHSAVEVVPLHNLLFIREPLPLSPIETLKIGFFGRIDIKQKNLDVLVRAFAATRGQRQNVELHLYGHGTEQEQLKEIVANLGVGDAVFFHGGYDHRHDLPRILASCHFFVYPSRYEGGPCFTLLELMQAGRFCVASRVGGIPDLYEGRPHLGLMVEPGNIDELIDALNLALEMIIAGKIDGEAIRARYHEGFDMPSAHRAWMKALQI
ncbi:MAG: glycosyltransferase family 4 protein [Pyrinomonadaceae bacterium MAG19_C2-C3]|nr:glycosyltransferase family 4 protein [Pyrinomonadaceae bacterium MAG19_C2-C3]